ncbi:interferon-inducible GTPase 5-like [Engraulis encrasicolus]|uniref:interferon-inducible GTPase 5-like n=1 Tax=Engraulis encrasicolus TaxID=184585 RepID=UPI002FD4CCEF
MDDISALLSNSGEQTAERAIAKAKEIVNGLVLNIAVTGETGVGKSSFLNAIRGVQRGDEGWAPTGVTETTKEPMMYPHPTMPNVRIWDLPGIGSPRFKAKTYLKGVKFEAYDLFIIVSASRFKENDIMLAKEIKNRRKNFYFVRSKMDLDISNEIESEGKTEEETLCSIREYCLANLCDFGPLPVFLISSRQREKFDFQKLIETLERDLPREKRGLLLHSLPVYSIQRLDEKYSAFKKTIWALAVASGGIGAAPVPGLLFARDTAMILSFLTKVYHSFGLHDKALEKLSVQVNKPILEEVKKSKLIQDISKSKVSLSMLTKLGTIGAVEILSCVVPVAGNIAAAAVSFVTTRAVLQEGLDELYGVAKKVLEMAELQ